MTRRKIRLSKRIAPCLLYSIVREGLADLCDISADT